MAVAQNTGSTLTLDDKTGGGRNKTSVALSTNIIIKVGGTSVGAVQEISFDEGRTIKMIDEVGTDGHIDSCPTSSSTINGSCKRIRFDRLRIAEAFSRSFVHVHSQVYPFDIEIYDIQKKDPSNQIVTVVKNVWIKSINYAYNADSWIISDTMNWEAETIFSFLAINGQPVARGGERGIDPVTRGLDPSVYNIEQAADTGLQGRRGSMDFSGIIDISGNLF